MTGPTRTRHFTGCERHEARARVKDDVERVVDVVQHAGLARKVARLKPLGVVKG